MANKKIEYDIGFNIDKGSLEDLRESLMNIKSLTSGNTFSMHGIKLAKTELQQIQETAIKISSALENSFNPRLNTMNFTAFNQQLKNSNLSIAQIKNSFSKMGSYGNRAFNELSRTIMTSNASLKSTDNFVTKLGTTFFNAAKWSVAYGAINNISNGIKSAWTYAISLDSSLNDIRIVTGKTADEMDRFAKNANKAAKALGTSTMDYTKGALIYYQQGLSDKDVLARTEVTAKAANVTGQSMKEVSEQLTAVWNGFKVVAEDSELYVDKLAAVAANSASDLEELSTAMSRVASTANALGINIDQLTSQISTIESITRQDAASIGTSLKTIYARMGDLAVGMEDEFGVTLGEVSGKLKKMGVDILDQNQNLRDMGDVIEEVASKWGGWTEAQRQAAAVAIAGKRQYNNLFALFENWDMYQSNLSVSENAEGTLQKQQNIYMESTAAHLEQLSAAGERIKDALFDNESVNKLIDALTWITDKIGWIIESVGGGLPIFMTSLGSIATMFASKIGPGIIALGQGFSNAKINAIELKAQQELYNQYQELAAKTDKESRLVLKDMLKIKEIEIKYNKILTDDQREQLHILIDQTKVLKEKEISLKKQQSSVNNLGTRYNLQEGVAGPLGKKKNFKIEDFDDIEPVKDKNGKINHYINSAGARVNKSKMDAAKNQVYENLNARIAERQQQYEAAMGKKDAYGEYLQTGTLQRIGRFKRNADPDDAYDMAKNEEAAKALQDQIKKTKELTESQKISAENAQKLSVSYNQYGKALGLTDKELKTGNITQQRAKEILETNRDATSQAGSMTKAYASTISDEKRQLDEAQGALQTNTAELKNNKMQMDENKNSAEGLTKTVENGAKVAKGTQILSSLMQITSVCSTLFSTMDSIKEGTFDITQALPALIGVIFSLVMAAKSLEAAGYKVQIAWFWVIGITAALFAVIAIVKAIQSQKSALEQAQESYDNMKKAANDLATALNNVKSEFEELEKSIEDYHDAQKAIDDLRVGTEEWAKAITEANANILELLDNYPALAKYISSDENGRLTISDEGLDYIKEQKQKEISDTQAASYNAKREELETQNKLLIEQNRKNNAAIAKNVLIQSYNDTHDLSYQRAQSIRSTTYLSYKDERDMQNQVEKPIKIIEDNMEAILKVFSSTASSQGKDNYEKLLRNSLLDVVGGNEQVVNALIQNKEELYKQSISLDENTKAQKLFNEQFVAEYYKNNENRKNAQNQTLWDRIMAQTDSDMEEQYTYKKDNETGSNQYMDAGHNGGDKGTVTDNFRADFAKANGLSAKEAKSIKLEGDNVVWTSDDGEKKTMAKNTAAELASAYNIERGKESEIKVRTNIANTMAGYGSLGYIAGGGTANIESATRAEAANYQKTLKEMVGEIQKTTGLSDEETLKKMVGEDSEYYKWFEANGKNLENTLNHIAEAEQKKVEETVENMSKGMDAATAKSWNQFKDSTRSKNMTAEQNQNVANAMQKAFNVGGTTGLDIFSTMFSSNNLNIDQISELSKVINNLDFTDPTAQEQFAAALDDIGLSFEDLAEKTGVSTDKLTALFDETGDAAGLLITKLDQFTDKIKAINELSGKFKIGEVFTKEEYESMIKMNYALKDYFIQYEDGFKVVKGTSEEVGEMLRKHFTVDDIKEQFRIVEEQASKLEDVFGKDTKATQQSVLDKFANNVNDLDHYAELIKKYGNDTTLSAFKEAFATLASESASQEAKNDAKKTIEQLASVFNQGISDKNLGNLKGQAAEESYVSSMYISLGALAKDRDKFTKEVYEKMRQSFLADYAQSFSLMESTFSKLADKLTDSEAVKALQYLQDFENVLSRISEQGKNLKGQDLANNITEQINASEATLDTMKEIIAVTQSELGIGGNFTYLEAYNKYLDALSKGLFAEDSDTAKKWEQFLKYLKEVEKTENSIVDKEIQRINAIVDGVKDVEELRRDSYKFRKENQVNSIKYKTGFSLGIEESIIDRRDIAETNMASYRNEAAAVSQGIRDIREKMSKAQTEEERAAYKAQLEDYEKQWREIVSNFNNELKELNSLWKEGLEDIGDSFDTLRSKIETLNEVYKSTIEINKKLGISLGNNTVLRNNQFVNYGKIIQTRQQELEAYLQTLTDLQKKGGKGTDLYKENLEKIQEATKDTLSDLISYAELANDLFSEQLDELFESFNSTALTQKWDTSKKLDEALLDTVNSRFEIEKLRDKFNEAIANADSIKAQKELTKVMEQQLAVLEEKDRLSQYEINRANQLYELTLKQIALEESQRNATKMRLVRDAAGNLTYAFTQDEDASNKAQEEAAAAQNSLYNLDKNQIKTSIDNYNSLLNEMKSELVDATQLTGAARDERMRDIINSYAGLLKNEQSTLNEAYNNLVGDGYTLDSRLVDAIDNVLGEDIDKLTSDTEKQAKEYQDNIGEITSVIDQVKDVISQGITAINDSLKSDEKSIADNVATIVRELQKLSTGLQKKFDLVYPEDSQKTVEVIDDDDKSFGWAWDGKTRAELNRRYVLSDVGKGRASLSNGTRVGLSIGTPQMNLATPSFNNLSIPTTSTTTNSNSVSYNINIGSVNSNSADDFISSVQGLSSRAVQRSFSSKR